jgi:hypothetical protein
MPHKEYPSPEQMCVGFDDEVLPQIADPIESLQADNERLRQWVNDLQSGMYVNCVYCGHRYGPEKDTPVSMADILKAHIEQCSEHPMSKLKAQLVERTAERDSYKRSFLAVEEERNECAKQLAESQRREWAAVELLRTIDWVGSGAKGRIEDAIGILCGPVVEGGIE